MPPGWVLWTDGGWYRMSELILCPAHFLDCVLCSPQLAPSSITPSVSQHQTRPRPTNQNGILGSKNFINQLDFVWKDELGDCTVQLTSSEWTGLGASGQDFQGTLGKLWRLQQYGLVWYQIADKRSYLQSEVVYYLCSFELWTPALHYIIIFHFITCGPWNVMCVSTWKCWKKGTNILLFKFSFPARLMSGLTWLHRISSHSLGEGPASLLIRISFLFWHCSFCLWEYSGRSRDILIPKTERGQPAD